MTRNVEVRRPENRQPERTDVIYYGHGYTGRAIDIAELMDPPRHQADRDWIEQVLATRITPDGAIHHYYGRSEPQTADPETSATPVKAEE
jgi:hypothetical protein